MTDALGLGLSYAAGAGLGAMFFGGLWWTVRRAIGSDRPALWFAGSLLLRTTVLLAGLYVVAGPRWERLLLCLLGFVTARVVVMRLTREARHAS